MTYRTFALAAVLGIGLALLPMAALAQSKEDIVRIFNEAGKLAHAAQNYEDMKRAVEKYQQAVKIFENVQCRHCIGDAANNLGYMFKKWGQYEKAVEYYEKSLAIKRELKDRIGEGNGLLALGNVYSDWSQHEKAVEYYEKSLTIARELNDKRGEGATLNNLGITYKAWGQYDKAIEFYEKSLAIAGDWTDRQREVSPLNNLGIACNNWDQFGHGQARYYYEKSLATARELKNKKSEGNILRSLGIISWNAGRYGKAKEYYEQSLAIARELKDKKGEELALNNLGNVFKLWGQYEKAKEYYEKSLAIARALKDKMGEGATLNNLGLVYTHWGQYDKAVEYYEKSLRIYRDMKVRVEQGRTLNNLGVVSAHRGEHKKALATFEEGLRIWKQIGVPTGWPMFNIGMVYLDMGQVEQAEGPLKESNLWSGFGWMYLVKSQYLPAEDYYHNLLMRAERSRNAESLFTAYTGLGCANEGLGHDGHAEEHFRKAVELTEELRSSLAKPEREKFFDVRINGFYRTAPYEGLARILTKMQKPMEAFRSSEYTKARVFAEGLARLAQGSALGVPGQAIRNGEEINDQLAALKRTRQNAYETNNQAVFKSLNPEIDDLESRRQAHIKMLREKYPLFAAVKYPEPMDLAQTALRDDEWVLSYDVTDPGLIVYLTKGKQLIKGKFKAIPRKELDELVRKFREPLEVGDEGLTAKKLSSFDFSSGKKLADILLGDILGDLPKGTQVIIVPDDSLGVLPFEMLVLNESGLVKTDSDRPYVAGAEFFGDRNPISYYQSVTALTLARTFGKEKKRAAKRLVMCDPIFGGDDDDRLGKMAKEKQVALLKSLPDKIMSMKSELNITFPRLPLTGVLGQSLKKMDPAATDEHNAMEAAKPMLFGRPLDGYGSMVFATHGYFGKDLPAIQEPVLVLTLVGQPEGKDGFLRMSEVMGLKLNADMVALTACQTGLGQRISGEGTMGMGRAFQFAGTRAVLMSLWSVAETSSVKLVESFFKHLKEGSSKLEALKLSRKEIREAGYDHPFFWAPFILVGEME